MSDWRVIGQTVRGAAHRRTGLPNQDALGWLPPEGVGPPLLLALADGHGSPKHFRSHEGSRLAVETAKEIASGFLAWQSVADDLPALVKERWPADLRRRWVEKVREHNRQHPFAAAELAAVEKKAGGEPLRLVEVDPLIAYGSTVIMVLIVGRFIAYLQLGDGDLTTVSADGVLSRPLPDDPRLFANETTSLASAGDDNVRVVVQPLNDAPPALVLACTDGYANSYPNVADPVAQFSVDLCKLIGTHGLDRVRANLPRWLTDLTEQGSGDDITVGVLCRRDLTV